MRGLQPPVIVYEEVVFILPSSRANAWSSFLRHPERAERVEGSYIAGTKSGDPPPARCAVDSNLRAPKPAPPAPRPPSLGVTWGGDVCGDGEGTLNHISQTMLRSGREET